MVCGVWTLFIHGKLVDFKYCSGSVWWFTWETLLSIMTQGPKVLKGNLKGVSSHPISPKNILSFTKVVICMNFVSLKQSILWNSCYFQRITIGRVANAQVSCNKFTQELLACIFDFHLKQLSYGTSNFWSLNPIGTQLADHLIGHEPLTGLSHFFLDMIPEGRVSRGPGFGHCSVMTYSGWKSTPVSNKTDCSYLKRIT